MSTHTAPVITLQQQSLHSSDSTKHQQSSSSSSHIINSKIIQHIPSSVSSTSSSTSHHHDTNNDTPPLPIAGTNESSSMFMSTTASSSASASVSSSGSMSYPLGESAVKDYYFDSYSHFGIHEEMLKDQIRTRSYMDSIMHNKQQFKDKVVLDIGCGTGILSMFAAKAGAKKVIGIECASIYHQALDIIRENSLSHIVTLVQARVEDLHTLPDGIEQVDIIISEWMGYFLLYESMLDTVLYARDKWLVKDGTGLILPDRATLHIAALEDREYRDSKIDYWSNVYGYKMNTIRELALLEPLVDVCESRQVISNDSMIVDIDIYSVTKEQLAFSGDFQITVNRNDYLHGFVCWFDIDFQRVKRKVHFSTSPHARYTHWKQTVFYLKDVTPVSKGEVIKGHITTKRNAHNPRDLDITLKVDVDGGQFPYHMPTTEYRLR